MEGRQDALPSNMHQQLLQSAEQDTFARSGVTDPIRLMDLSASPDPIAKFMSVYFCACLLMLTLPYVILSLYSILLTDTKSFLPPEASSQDSIIDS